MSTALVIGDVQAGILETFPWSRTVLGPLQSLLPQARATGVHLIYVRAALRGTQADIPQRNPIATWMAGAGELFHEDSPQTRIHPDIAPSPDEPVVTKRRVSAFTGTDLDSMLRARDVHSIVLAGVATSGVVLATLIAAVELDYAVTVLTDCCADQDEAVHTLLTTVVFPGRGARILTASDWITEISDSRALGERPAD